MNTSASADALPTPLRSFVRGVRMLIDAAPPEDELLMRIQPLMAALVQDGGWIPPQKMVPRIGGYAQHLLYRDPAQDLSIVCFVWDKGQSTPIHDHGTWGVIGVVRGAEISQAYELADGKCIPCGAPERIEPGSVSLISSAHNIHQVRNALDDSITISIHAYGADIGRIERSTFEEDGQRRAFVSGYEESTSNT